MLGGHARLGNRVLHGSADDRHAGVRRAPIKPAGWGSWRIAISPWPPFLFTDLRCVRGAAPPGDPRAPGPAVRCRRRCRAASYGSASPCRVLLRTFCTTSQRRVTPARARYGTSDSRSSATLASSGRRVDVPDHPASQQLARMPHAALELRVALRRENRAEPLWAHGGTSTSNMPLPLDDDAASRALANIAERELHMSRPADRSSVVPRAASCRGRPGRLRPPRGTFLASRGRSVNLCLRRRTH